MEMVQRFRGRCASSSRRLFEQIEAPIQIRLNSFAMDREKGKIAKSGDVACLGSARKPDNGFSVIGGFRRLFGMEQAETKCRIRVPQLRRLPVPARGLLPVLRDSLPETVEPAQIVMRGDATARRRLLEPLGGGVE